FTVVDLLVELVDQLQTRGEGARPWLRQLEPVEQVAAGDAEQIGDRTRLAVGEQDRVHALLEAGAVTDEMQPEARPLPLGTDGRIGEPDRRHQITTRQLGEHPGVDPVGLARQRCQPFHLDRVGDLDPPTGELELIVNKTSAVHRLDRREDRLAEAADTSGQAVQTIGVRRRGADLDLLAQLIEQAEVETLAAEIQSSVQHAWGLPSSLEDARSMTPREALLHRIPSPV